jgi:hypothetical protein
MGNYLSLDSTASSLILPPKHVNVSLIDYAKLLLILTWPEKLIIGHCSADSVEWSLFSEAASGVYIINPITSMPLYICPCNPYRVRTFEIAASIALLVSARLIRTSPRSKMAIFHVPGSPAAPGAKTNVATGEAFAGMIGKISSMHALLQAYGPVVRGITLLAEVDVIVLALFAIKLAILTQIFLSLFSISVNLMIAGHNLVGMDTSILGEFSMNTIVAILFSIYILQTSPEVVAIKIDATAWSGWTAAWLERAVDWVEGRLARLHKSIAPSVHQKLFDKYSRAKIENSRLASIGTKLEARYVQAERKLSSVQREHERLQNLANEWEMRLDVCRNQMGIKDEVIAEMAQKIGLKNSQIEGMSERYIAAKEELGRHRRTADRLQKQLDQASEVRILEVKSNAVAAAELASSRLQPVLDAIGVTDVADALEKISSDKATAEAKSAALETTRADLESLLDAIGTRDVGQAVGRIAKGQWAARVDKSAELLQARDAAEAVVADVDVVLKKLGVKTVAELWQKLVQFDADFVRTQIELGETTRQLELALETLKYGNQATQPSQGVAAADASEAPQSVAAEPHEDAGEEPRTPMDIERKLCTGLLGHWLMQTDTAMSEPNGQSVSQENLSASELQALIQEAMSTPFEETDPEFI